MNEHERERALQRLFAEHGSLQAPKGMESRIMHRIALMPRHVAAIERSLLPKWAWVVAGALLLGLIAIGLSSPSDGAATMPLPEFDLASLLRSKWMLASVGCAALLFGLEHWLGSKRSRGDA